MPETTETPLSLRQAPRRILIVRLSAIGDIVFASPLIAALRQAWPQAEIAWLAQPECRALLDQHPQLDRVIICPLKHWRTLLHERRLLELTRGIAALRSTLRAQRFDLALDLQGLLKSGALTWLSGAPERIGLGSREGSQWLMTQRLPRGGPLKRIGSEYLYLANRLGLPTASFEMAIYYDPVDARFAEAVIEREGLSEGYVTLCPFTTRPQKHWIESYWATLAEHLYRELGLISVILGGPGDQTAAARILGCCETPLVDLSGRTSLTEAAALIDRALLSIGVDTGLGHLGIAMNTPSLLLFGSTCPYLDTTRANARVLYHPLPCSPCKRRPTCDGRFDCMWAITPEQVLEAVRGVLS